MAKKSFLDSDPVAVEIVTEVRREEALLKAGALQNAIFNSANFSSIATDEKGVALLQKPFTPSALARKVREVLGPPGAPKPDPAQKIFGFTKISEEVKTSGN